MNIKAVQNIVTRFAGRNLLVVQKHSPVILTTVGVLGSITSTVLASRATLHLEEKVVKLEEAKEVAEQRRHLTTEPDFDHAEHRKALTHAYARFSLDLIKLYGPAVAVGAASVGCLVGAQGIMQQRNASLTAAYVALDKGFKEYRKRVEDVIGKEAEEKLRYDVREVRKDDPKKGVVDLELEHGPGGASVYARFFDECSSNWRRDAELNLTFLKGQERYMNNLLHAQGHLFLNEVYDALGIERSKAGAVVGWVLGKGDNYVDFGLGRVDNEGVRDFVNGRERSILLDFNVDGLIWDLI